ncbi:MULTISPECIES: DUF1778 domain-containing protein [unclassified Bradyrhizobium]|uniref:type II toxin -antitoxin system TacA 1-like antitoxin n=1 Tax=unclassified Bradyrhizobium TaxID=2631580 RepID=UPI002915D9DA|nr:MULTISPECIES: DUF1778 domain-containing protein [unclassified Bradyrhizobium]
MFAIPWVERLNSIAQSSRERNRIDGTKSVSALQPVDQCPPCVTVQSKPHLARTEGPVRAERLDARVSAAHQSLIKRSAALQGRSATDFLLASVQDAGGRQ